MEDGRLHYWVMVTDRNEVHPLAKYSSRPSAEKRMEGLEGGDLAEIWETYETDPELAKIEYQGK